MKRNYIKQCQFGLLLGLSIFATQGLTKESSSAFLLLSTPSQDKQIIAAKTGETLYQWLKQQQWDKAEALLQQYEQLPFKETLLVDYAKAQLAQAKGHWLKAEYYYQQLLTQKADFIPANTGLFHLYFQQGDYPNAKQQLKTLSQLPQLPEPLYDAIEYYQRQLIPYFQGTRFYQVSLHYNDNVNMASGIPVHIMPSSSRVRITKKGASPIESMGMSHLFSLYHPYFLSRQHSMSVYAQTRYIDYFSIHAFNQLSFYTQLTYHYKQPYYQIHLSPLYEIKSQNNQYEYQQWGINFQLNYPFYRTHLLSWGIEYKEKEYREKLNNFNSEQLASYFTFKYKLNDYSQLVNQLTYQKKRKKNHLLNYQQYGIKSGIHYRVSSQWNVDLFLAYKFKEFDNYNPFFKQKRKDDEINLSINIKKTKPLLWNFYPVTELRYTRNLSNVAWLYRYQQREILFKLEKTF